MSPREWATGEVSGIVEMVDVLALPPAPRAHYSLKYCDLGFRFAPPQALCFRLLRRLEDFIN